MDLAQYIDHTLLNPDATEEDIKRVCKEAIEHHFKTVCILPKFLALAVSLLKGKKTVPIAVVDFPKGDGTPDAKAREAKKAVEMGAKEIDMVINWHALKEGKFQEVLEGIQKVVAASTPYPVKVILETCYLNEDEKIIACAFSKAAGAAFVKTSTGFGKGGATVEDVALMRRIVGSKMGVKASGGIRTREDAMKMIEAGANRIGASSSVAIVKGGSSSKDGY